MLLPLSLKTVLVVAHVLGVAVGVGGVLMLDIYLLKFVRGSKIKPRDIGTIGYVSLFVKTGLMVVWASGVLIIGWAPEGAAVILANPKLQAKLLIVVVLTLNALFIETLVLPLIKANMKRSLFHGITEGRRMLLLVFGAVSTTSWTFPLLLGLAREWNRVIPAENILEIYGCALLSLSIGLCLVVKALHPGGTKRAARKPAASTATEDILLQILDMQANLLAQQAEVMRRVAPAPDTANVSHEDAHATTSLPRRAA